MFVPPPLAHNAGKANAVMSMITETTRMIIYLSIYLEITAINKR